jgi:hypothetical protein
MSQCKLHYRLAQRGSVGKFYLHTLFVGKLVDTLRSAHPTLTVLAHELVIVRVASNPKPEYPIGYINTQCSIVEASAH